MAQYQVLYWRDIPVQVKVWEGRRPRSGSLPSRFQVAIDRIAMAEGLTGSDAYLQQWQWSEKEERPGEPQALMQVLLQELEAEGEHRLQQYGEAP